MSKTFTVEQIEAVIGDANMGFCIECGIEAYGVEPDACNYKCDACGAMQVFGAEEIVIMGLVE